MGLTQIAWLSVFQAEVLAVTKATERLSALVLQPSVITFFIDSQAAIKAISAVEVKSKLVSCCREELKVLSAQHCISLCWVPGHMGSWHGSDHQWILARQNVAYTPQSAPLNRLRAVQKYSRSVQQGLESRQQPQQQSFSLQQRQSEEVPLRQQNHNNEGTRLSQNFLKQQIQLPQEQQKLQTNHNIVRQRDIASSNVNFVPNLPSNPHTEQQNRVVIQDHGFVKEDHDIHTQHFLTLRNLGYQVSPPQSSPLKPYSNTLFSPQQPQYQHENQQHYEHQFSTSPPLGIQTEEKIPSKWSTAPHIVSENQIKLPPQTHNFQSSTLLPFIPQPELSYQQQQQQPTSFLTNVPGIPRFDIALSPEQEYKQKLIQKHEQFVQKQYEKSQNKVKQLHEDFVNKQHIIKHDVPERYSQHLLHSSESHRNTTRSRPVFASELNQFYDALRQYNIEHSTSTTPATRQVKESPAKISQRTLGENETRPRSKTKTTGRDEILKQLKTALAESPKKNLKNETFETMELVLPSGERVQIIRTQDPNLIKGQQSISQSQLDAFLAAQSSSINDSKELSQIATKKNKELQLPRGHKLQIETAPESGDKSKSGFELSKIDGHFGIDSNDSNRVFNSIASSAIISSNSDEPPTIEELAKKGLIPEGYEIEGFSSKRKANPPLNKKSTYVYLEEQADGSFRIQGVKANGEKETKTTGAEVENILQRIRNAEIKLPPSVTSLILPNDRKIILDNGKIVQKSDNIRTTATIKTTTPSKNNTTTTKGTILAPSTSRPKVTVTRSSQSSYSTTVLPLIQRFSDGHLPTESKNSLRSKPQQLYQDSLISYITTPQPVSEKTSQISSTNFAVNEKLAATIQQEQNFGQNLGEELVQILKSNGLFAMAKYLKTSGLDSILNETGPYTVFVPTDKAFKNLLIQLGGPERAEDKFKSNPRLLSGLLLHHVIPGAFGISSLQDEMTGISLAGTQLRVNQYTMHDQEWNDVVLTTINGAMVVNILQDIKIPQGIAHAVDRVMFPLPVGDLLQTLQSDREGRFMTFLKIVYTSGLSEKLQGKGIKTYTIFAPTERAFKELEPDVLETLFTDKNTAEKFIMKHIVPGTLFSAGMRFYQVKDSLLTGKTIILQKTSTGKIKVNDSQMITSNIPSTNGVIHAIDTTLS